MSATRTVDLLVVGAGAGGMAAALVAAAEGLSVLVCEKGEQLGGTTSTSAGTVWIPGSSHSVRAGVPDTAEKARIYLDSIIGLGGDRHLRGLREVFLATAARAIDDLERHGGVAFTAAVAHPDYLSNHPGAAFGGRALNAAPFDGRRLGPEFARIRPARPELMVLGGMMVSKADIPALLKPLASIVHARHVAGLLVRHARDRLRHARGTRLVMGNALVARLFSSLRRQGVPILFGTTLAELSVRDGSVVGAVLENGAGRQQIATTRGVVLATGGIGRNAALRRRLFPAAAARHSLAPATTTGDGMVAAERAGAMPAAGRGTGGLWMPVIRDARPRMESPHFFRTSSSTAPSRVCSPSTIPGGASPTRRTPITPSSRRCSAHGCTAGRPAYLVCDRPFIRDYGIGFIHRERGGSAGSSAPAI